MKKKKRIYYLVSILCFILVSSVTHQIVFASDNDNTYAGMDTMEDDLNTCIDDIIKHSDDFGSVQKLKEEEIDFSRTRRQYDVDPSILFKERKATADSLKEIIENSEYAYFVLIYRGTETFNFIIEKGTEPDPEKVKQGLFTEEALAYFEKYLGKWHVTGSGDPYFYLEPKNDCFGLMEKYLELKDIHNAEIYFIGRVNNECAYYAVVFTGQKTESGEDEIIFVGVEQLEYDDQGNLVYNWYSSGIRDYTEAEYTYAEMRKKYKGNLFNNQLFDWINTGTWVWLCIAIMVIGCVVAIIVGKKKAK